MPNGETQFFTDRSLYRPGQTVYFKGILLQRDERDMPQIIPNTEVAVRFLDANSQEKSRLKLRTNEYGTFQRRISGASIRPDRPNADRSGGPERRRLFQRGRIQAPEV
ncbi:MAG: hypothetical protein IPM98_11555 [Lewinellaceae bacterium]|nr:hypothetical protein [Lewinellaceae bacterium]